MKAIERLTYKLRNIKTQFLHRFVWKTHILNMRGLERGTYYEIEEKMFQALTQLFEEYVEKQLVPLFLINDDKTILDMFEIYDPVMYLKFKEYSTDTKFNKLWTNREYWKQELPWFSLSYGIYQLDSEMNSKNMSKEEKVWFINHIELHRKIQDIFVRIQIRKSRKDAFCEEYMGPEFIDKNGNVTDKWLTVSQSINQMHPEYSKYLDRCGKKEEQYKQDDDELMNDIISIRHHLWT